MQHKVLAATCGSVALLLVVFLLSRSLDQRPPQAPLEKALDHDLRSGAARSAVTPHSRELQTTGDALRGDGRPGSLTEESFRITLHGEGDELLSGVAYLARTNTGTSRPARSAFAVFRVLAEAPIPAIERCIIRFPASPEVPRDTLFLVIVVGSHCPLLLDAPVGASAADVPDCGVVRLRRGEVPRFLVHSRGTPVPGATVSLADWALEMPDGELLQSGVTDGAGLASFRYPIEFGQHDLRIEATGFASRGDERFVHDGRRHDIEVTETSTWSGLVVRSGTDPLPFPDLDLVLTPAAPADEGVGSTSIRTNAVGRFHVALPGNVRAARIAAVRHGVMQELGVWTQGDSLRLICDVRRLSLRVTSAHDPAAPIVRFGVRICAAAPGAQTLPEFSGVVAAGTHANGEYALHLLPGDHLLQVVPLERAWLPSLPVVVRLDQDAQQTILLTRAGELTVAVRTDDDTPVSQAIIAAITSTSATPPGSGTIPTDVLAATPSFPADHIRWDTSVTDSGGIADLRVPDMELFLRVSASGWVEQHVHGLRIPPAGRMYLITTLQRAARVAGRIQAGPDWPLERHGIVLCSPADGRSFPHRSSLQGRVRILPDRSFVIENVPPGRWDVHWMMDTLRQREPVTSISLTPGQETVVTLDAPEPAWKRVRVRLSTDGQPAARGWTLAMYREEDALVYESVPRRVTALVEEAGECMTVIPTGTYRAYLTSGDDLRAGLAPASVSDESEGMEFSFAALAIHAELVDDAGQPLIGRDVHVVESTGARSRHFATTDGSGRVLVPVENNSPCALSISGTSVKDYVCLPLPMTASPQRLRVSMR
ncbi:MAG: carboxypeptidase regulatory-like domain-containing protein [Planctomycetes bacterium]|nr:carboxypeptidase regulatory-like domain-containing protein [Planctomycetota bacterium]